MPDEPPPTTGLAKVVEFVTISGKSLGQLSSSGKAAKDKRRGGSKEGKAHADPSDHGKGGSQEGTKEQKK